MIVQSKHIYDELTTRAAEIVVGELGYPNYVFRHQYKFVLFAEYSVATSSDVVAELAECCNDDHVYFVYLKPRPEEFWFPQYGHFGAIKLHRSDIRNCWRSELTKPFGSKNVTMYGFDGHSMMFGESRSWCVFHDYGYDLSVIVSNYDLRTSKIRTIQNFVHDVEWATSYWKTSGSPMSDDFYSDLQKNYV